mgnify:CR=1 FL=1
MAGVSLHSLPLFVRLGGRAVILIGEGEQAEQAAAELKKLVDSGFGEE